MGYVKGLRCKECGRDYEKLPIHVCEFCFGPLEVNYDYENIKKVISDIYAPAEATAKRLSLSLDDLFEERVDYLSKFCAEEQTYFVLM